MMIAADDFMVRVFTMSNYRVVIARIMSVKVCCGRHHHAEDFCDLVSWSSDVDALDTFVSSLDLGYLDTYLG